jgi:LacI family transcriptional regulator
LAGNPKPTIYTVAEKAGVSIATVSRVLNDRPRVKQETRARVIEAIQDLGYRPSALARERAVNRTEILALVFPDMAGPFYSALIQGATSEVNNHGYSLLVYGTRGRDDTHAGFLHLLPTKVDGFILMTRAVNDAYVHHLYQQRIPFVLLDRQMEEIEVDSILVDNVEGAYHAAEHLLQHGHSQVAFIGGPAGSPNAEARFEGYRRALEDHGLSLSPRLVERGDFVQPGGYQAMGLLLDRLAPPLAVFVANDEMAIGAVEAIRGRGLSIPDNVAIIGFDDIQIASYIRPPLTTVRQPINRLGSLAVQRLLRRIADPETEAETIVLPTELVIRRSCGCIP